MRDCIPGKITLSSGDDISNKVNRQYNRMITINRPCWSHVRREPQQQNQRMQQITITVTGSHRLKPVKTLLNLRRCRCKRNNRPPRQYDCQAKVNPHANSCIVLLYARTQNRKVVKSTRRNKYIQNKGTDNTTG